MATNSVKIDLQLNSQGMDSAVQKSETIKNNLKAASVQMPGTAGSRALAEKAASQQYAAQRAVAGGTGASARNFAAEAQGLGGIVRLYATIAANTFAAAAAFKALSTAMDTANMVKGLDQLGAISGVALGGLSKRLAESTEGAISLREAMQATVQATSAGLNTEQVMKLGEVAKKASQALGLNMTDAISRLSRGITKLEPELLDELGIFTKIGDATAKYSISVGKSAASLTDFEKRQAFANAVLEEGLKKFGDINIESNPYAKLAATIQNLTQSVLEFLNKGLVPVARFLSENTAILGSVFAFIGMKLVQAALPAIGAWQQGLIRSAEVAKITAQEINTAYGEAFVQRWNDRLRIPELKKSVEEAKAILGTLSSALSIDKMGKGKAAFGRISLGEGTARDFTTANKLIEEQKAKYEELLQANNNRANATTRALKKEIELRQQLLQVSKEYVNQEKSLADASRQFEKGAIESKPSLSERARQAVSDNAARTAIALSAVAEVSKNTLQKGFGEAMSILNQELNVKGVGYIKRFAGLAAGGMAAAATSVGLFVNAISGWIGIVTTAITIGYTFLSLFSNTKKETQATDEGFTRLNETLKTNRDLLERISLIKDPLEKISVENLQAKATAAKELGESIVLSQKRAFDEISKMNPGDLLVNFVKRLWGGDVQSKLAEGLTDSLVDAFKLAEEGPAKQEAKRTIETLLGTSINSKELSSSIKTLVKSGDVGTLNQVTASIKSLGDASAVSAAKTTELKESAKKLSTDLQEFNKGLLPTDSISKFATDAIESAQKLQLALDDPTKALAAMRQVAGDINLLAIFPPETARALMSYRSELDKIAASLEQVRELSKEDKDQLKDLNDRLATLRTAPGGVTPSMAKKAAELEQQIRELEAKPLQLQAEIVNTDVSRLKQVFDSSVRESLIKSSQLMGARVASEIAKAQTTVTSTIAGLLGDTAIGIKLRTETELKNIDASMAVVRESFNLALEMEKLRTQFEIRNLMDKKESLRGPGEEESPELKQVNKRLKDLEMKSNLLENPSKISRESSSKMLAGIKASGDQDIFTETLNLVQKFEMQQAALAGGRAQKEAVKIKEKMDLLKQQQQEESRLLDIKIQQTNIESDSLTLARESGNINEREFLEKSNILAIQKIQNDYDKKELDIGYEYNRLSILGSELFKQGKVDLANKVEKLAKEAKKRADSLNSQEKAAKLSQQEWENIKKQADYSAKRVEQENLILDLVQERANLESTISLELAEIDFDTRQKTVALFESEIAAEKKILDIRKTTQEYELKNQQARKKYLDSLNALSRDSANLTEQEQVRRLAALNDVYNTELKYNEDIKNAKIRGIDQVAEYERSKALTEGISDAIVTALVEGGKEGSKKFRDILTAELRKPIDVIVKALVQPLISGLTSAASSIGGSILSSAGGSLLGSLGMSALGASLSMASIKTMAANFGSGIATGISSTLGTLPASQAAVLAGTTDIGVGAAAAGAGTGTTAGGIGSSIGAALPYVGAAVLALNALGVFRSTKTVGSGLMGTLGGGDIQSYDLRRKSGSLFTGPSYSLGNVQESQLSDAIQAAFKTARTATAGLADALGLSSDAVKNFTTTLGKEIINPDLGVRGLKLEGLTPEQQMQKVQEALADANEEMAKLVLGTDRYNKLNEKYLDALTRLSSSLAYVNDVFKDLGFTLKTTGLEGANSASKLVDALGGLNSAQSKLSFVYENFYTDTQKQANLTEKATNALGKYNLQLPKTREGYVDLLRAASSLSDPALFSTIVDLAPAIDNLIKYSEDAAKAAEDNADLRAELLDAEGKTSKALELRRATELKSLNAVDAAMKRRIFALEDERAAYDKLKSALQDTVNVLGGSAKSLRDAQRSLVSGADSFQSPEQRLATLVSQFNAAIEQARGPVDTAEQRTAVETAAQTAVRLSSDIKSAADVLYASGTENQLLRGMLADKLGEAATILESAKTDTQIQIEQLKTSNVYLEEISKDNKLLLEEYKAANAATVATPGVPLPPTTVAPTAASDSVVTELQNSIAVQKAANDLLQKQLELQAEQLRSNAAAMQAQTEALNRAAEERRLAEEYTARNVPTYMGEIGGGP